MLLPATPAAANSTNSPITIPRLLLLPHLPPCRSRAQITAPVHAHRSGALLPVVTLCITSLLIRTVSVTTPQNQSKDPRNTKSSVNTISITREGVNEKVTEGERNVGIFFAYFYVLVSVRHRFFVAQGIFSALIKKSSFKVYLPSKAINESQRTETCQTFVLNTRKTLCTKRYANKYKD